MLSLLSTLRPYIPARCIAVLDLNALIHKDAVNQRIFTSAWIGTLLFFALHSNEFRWISQ